MNWDDLKFVLAVAECGSVSAGARHLGMNHTTVLRRIAQIEDAMQLSIFEHQASGYKVTREGARVVASAARIRAELQALDRTLTAGSLELDGQIRLTTTDSLMMTVIGPALSEFQRGHPRIMIELLITNQVVDLARRQADVAIRPTRTVPQGMQASRVASLRFALYASRRYLQTDPGAPNLRSDWLVTEESLMLSPTQYWMRTHHPHAKEKVRADSFVALARLAEQGQGLAVLPCFLGDTAELVRIGAPLADIDTSLWVMTPADMAGAARIDAFCKHMTVAIQKQADLLEGRLTVSQKTME
ncbi:MAG: LysR family transcriptional regulator [Burkholderiaceae bacterium]